MIQINKNEATSNPFIQVASFQNLKSKLQTRFLKDNAKKSEVVNQVPAKEMNDGVSETLNEDVKEIDQIKKKRNNSQSSGSSENDESVTFE